MRHVLLRIFKEHSFALWLAVGFYKNPIGIFFAIYRSLVATRQLTGRFFPLKVRIGAGQALKVSIHTNAKVILNGNLYVNSWGGSNSASSIACAGGSNLTLSGDFEIGPNVHIILMKQAILNIGGRLTSSGSGMTCDTRVMVEQKIDIGFDTIIAWNVTITDSNWHDIADTPRRAPVSIGNHVWISHDVSILKGAVIPAGCIVGARSLVTSAFEQEKSLLVGTPARAVRSNMEWTR